MSLKEMLRPNSKGDTVAIPGIFLMVLSVILIQIYESYWCLIPLGIGFLLLGVGIVIDREKENEQKRIKPVNKEGKKQV